MRGVGIRLIVVVLCVMLTACSGRVPQRNLVERAIALQFGQTQTELASQLRYTQTPQPSFSISDIRIESRQPLTIETLKAFRVTGTYTLTLTYPNHTVVQRRNPFEVYLQRQIEGKTWRLARLPSRYAGDSLETEDRWVTQLIP